MQIPFTRLAELERKQWLLTSTALVTAALVASLPGQADEAAARVQAERPLEVVPVQRGEGERVPGEPLNVVVPPSAPPTPERRLTPREEFERDLAALQEGGADGLSGVSAGDTLPLFAGITLNGLLQSPVLVLRHKDGRWLAAKEQLTAWQLTDRLSPTVIYEGVVYYDLSAWPGYAAQFDPVQTQLNLQFDAAAFVGGGFAVLAQARPKPLPTGYGAYVNYDVLAQGSRAVGNEPLAGSNGAVNALVETVLYGPLGRLENTLVGNQLGRPLPGGERYTRLDTTFFHDFIDSRSTLAVGDYTGRSGLWGRPRRAGGVQFSTNFATQPGFITTPLLSFNGASSTPAVIDVVLNGNRQRVGEVESGPFAVTDIPVINGAGEAQLIVTDVLGREQIIRQSYITGSELLRAGVTDYSFEAGLMREGVRDRYKQLQAVAQVEHGVTNQTTLELRAEASKQATALGLGINTGLPGLGIVQAVGVGSFGETGTGALGQLGYRLPVNRNINFNANLAWTTPEFRDSSQERDFGRPMRETTGSLGFRLPFNIYAALGYAAQRFRPGETTQTDLDAKGERSLYTLSASRSLGPFSLSFTGQQQQGATRSRSGSLNASYRFGQRGPGVSYSATRSKSDSSGGSQQQVSIANTQTQEAQGLGWRANLRQQRTDNGSESGTGDVLANWRLPVTELEGGLARSSTRWDWRAGLRGGFGLAGGVPFVARRVTRSLAVLDEPALAGLPVLVNGQKITTFSAKGRAVLPQLTPYAENKVKVDLEDADWNIDASRSEAVVIPGNRTGHRVALGGRRVFGALVLLKQGDGSPVPVGTVVSLESTPERFVVADGGEVYVVSLTAKTLLRFKLAGAPCVLALDIPTVRDGIAQLGPYTCKSASLSLP